MKLTEIALNKKLVSYILTLLIICGGIMAYSKIGRLEFPTFTIKTALVMTSYPGASALEVEQEVTDPMEEAVQKLSQVKEVRSLSRNGLSIIFVDLKDQYVHDQIPQVWDELRKKVRDAQVLLPPGAGPSRVNDDFGDEYGVFFAIHGSGFSFRELKDYADLLKRELLLVENVASVELWGEQQEVITLEMSRSRMSQLGISMTQIIGTLNNQNQVIGAGSVDIGNDYVRISPTGNIMDVEDLGELLIQSDQQGNVIYLKDVVTIRRGYQDPPSWLMHYNGQPAIGLGISIVDDGNVVEMGKSVKKRMAELQSEMPVGMEIGTIAFQSDTVSESVDAFIINLVEAVIIVILVLCLTMGISSGLLMGAILLLTIFGTFIFMQVMGVSFQLISLGALILALGMLVDNAIVVTEGILIKSTRGMDKTRAAMETVKQTAWPLFGATLVAILAFAAIGTSQDSTGEFLNSLFLVMTISLGLSWVLAITITPLFCIRFLPDPKPDTQKESNDPYAGLFYRAYRTFLNACLNNKVITIGLLLAALAAAIYGFSFVENSFFPKSRRPQFLVDLTRPEGTRIQQVRKDLAAIEQHLAGMPDVTATTSFCGQGALRFLLTYEPEMPNPAYGQVLVTVDDYRKIDALIPEVRKYLVKHYPDSDIKLAKFALGPGGGAKIEARFSGPDIRVLRNLALQARTMMADDVNATEIKDDYRQPVMVMRPRVKEADARRLGITRQVIADTLAMNYSGKTIGVFREDNTLIPMQIRAPMEERARVDEIDNLVVFSPVTGAGIPMKQIVSAIEPVWEDPIIHRRDRKRTITAQCNPMAGNASVLFNRLRPQIESIELPPGYSLEWGGEYKNSNDANASLFRLIPFFFLAMVLIVLFLFNALRQTLIIYLCLPLSVIGVTSGLLISGEPFGFMCLLGFIGLSGMLIKNALVLIDQIDLEIREGKSPFQAVLDSSVSRLRPVMMAAVTTVMGMLPLMTDPFYVGMSITIISGLSFGTILTLIIVPVLYASMFRIKPGHSG
ncbi:MAG: efflux RND transporter permease subunit [Desulfobacteraceae bacterium]|nr:MAG: efflux RND transporter permease subunit [Desulfobacteraceae bacterium]